jgi:hypothetical protein
MLPSCGVFLPSIHDLFDAAGSERCGWSSAITSKETRQHVLWLNTERSAEEETASEAVKCLECEAVFIVSEGFPEAKLLEALETHQMNLEPHPDSIPSEASWTIVAECNCGL